MKNQNVQDAETNIEIEKKEQDFGDGLK